MVKKIVKTGHKNVYLLKLKHSNHGSYILDNQENMQKYQNFSDALYKSLNLPHIPKFADAGKDLVEAAKMNARALK